MEKARQTLRGAMSPGLSATKLLQTMEKWLQAAAARNGFFSFFEVPSKFQK